MKETIKNIITLLWMPLLMVSCSVTKDIPENQFLLNKVDIKCDDKTVSAASLEPYIRQRGNSRWFSLFRVPLGAYSMAGRDTTKWINRTLRNIGEQPVIYDTIQSKLTRDDLVRALQSMGYIHADANVRTKIKGRKVDVCYTLVPGVPYFIGEMHYDIADDSIAAVLDKANVYNDILKKGEKLTVDRLDTGRKKIVKLLADNGYYRFHKDFINYTVDTISGVNIVDVTMHIIKYRANNNSPETIHPRYRIDSIYYSGGEDGNTHLRKNVLRDNTWISSGDYYCASDLQRTYNNFGRLSALKYTNIKFEDASDTLLLDCNIQVSAGKPNSISFQPEGTNTAGDLGAAASLTYENRNIFRGSETFSVSLRGAFEAITGLEGYQNQNYKEYSAEAKLLFPRMIAPFLSRRFRRHSLATSELSLGYNMQNRPEFHRRVFSAAWRYRWSNRNKRSHFRVDLLDLNYVYMPWISSTFKSDYLDNVSNKNAILRYNYEDLFIMKIGAGFSYNDGANAVKAAVETSGNVLGAVNRILGDTKNSNGQYTFFNIAYAQYAKIDFDYTHLFHFSENNQLAMHVGVGVAYPYGNSNILPFEKRYFSGGANSVRGWHVRGLGPGKFKGVDGRIDFINQTGDMKLDLNLEYRTFLFWKIYGAAFVDAGNIWTLREYEEQPGGKFDVNEFYKQLAVSYGLGLRLNFDYFILRFDMGMKAINPAYDTESEHYAVFHPVLSRDFTFHFSVGLPF